MLRKEIGKVERDVDRLRERERRVRERREKKGRGTVGLCWEIEMLVGYIRHILACCEFITEF